MANQLGIDAVDGVVIGGETINGRLFYEDRPQGPMLYGINDAEIREKANKYLAKLKEECNEAFHYIYPNKSWTVRFYQ